uniref:Uncharacterized protein n=1 Tax=Amazona collaria TaxID=241587 RepID=A0A8B9IZB5_9PSIT
MSLISEPSLEPVPSSASADSSSTPHSLTVLSHSKHPSASHTLPSQGKSAETALDELWALELSTHVPDIQAENDSTLNPVYEPSVVALDRWDVFPDTKKQLGFAVEKGQELKAEVLRETKVDGCPDQVKKRQSRDRTAKAGAANVNKARGDQENEQFRSPAVTPESPEHIWKAELDLPCASKPPIERISASGQAGFFLALTHCSGLCQKEFWHYGVNVITLLLTIVTNGLSLCCCILGLALTLLFSADIITFFI